MKITFLGLILTFVFGSVSMVNAQTEPTMKVRVGKKGKDSKSKITVKFVSVAEDSRCPEGTTCVWAGNAVVKVQVSKDGSNPITFDANTTLGEKGNVYEGYAIYLTSLSPAPKSKKKNDYTATFTVTRLSR